MTLLASVDGVKPRLALLAILLLQACGIRLSRRSDIRKLNLVHEPAATSGILPSALSTLRASRVPAPIMPTPIMPGQHIGGSLGPHMSRPLPQNQTRSLGAGQTGYLDDLTGRAGLVDSYMAFAGLDQLASAVKTDLQDKRQRTRSAKVWMAWDARSLGSSSEYLYDTFLEESSEYLSSTLTEAENTFVDTMGYVDATLQEFLESDDGWLVAMLINTLDMTPQKKDPLEDLQSQFIFGVRTDVIGLINRLSFVEKVRLMFKVVRESVTWVMVQKPFKRKISAVRLLIRRFTVPRDRWGKPDLSILYAGSTGEESLILRNLNDEFKGLGLQLLTELAPRLEEVAASDFRQSAPGNKESLPAVPFEIKVTSSTTHELVI